jgi:DNA-binding beta-propeller fold protein YncE
MSRFSTSGFAALLLALLAAPGHLAGEAAVKPAPVWPAAPEQPRLAFLRNISAPADLGIKPSSWARMGSLFTGIQKDQSRLQKPCGIAVDDEGNLCVTDTGNGSVCFFDLRRKKFRQWKKIGGIVLRSPVAVAKKRDTFLVADSQLGAVLAFKDADHLLFSITNPLARPVGLAFLSDHIFVADSQLHSVVVFDWTGHFLFQFGKRGVGAGEFNFPTHIASGPQGKLFVTDAMNSRVEIFDTLGRFQSAIGERGDSSGHFTRPKGVATDSAGNVYVADALFDNLQIFDQSGRFLLDVGSTGSGPGQFWMPAGLAISSDNKLFVADSYNRRVQVFQCIEP